MRCIGFLVLGVGTVVLLHVLVVVVLDRVIRFNVILSIDDLLLRRLRVVDAGNRSSNFEDRRATKKLASALITVDSGVAPYDRGNRN